MDGDTIETIKAVLVLVIGVPIVLAFRWFITHRRGISFTAGLALARWTAGEGWRTPFLAVVIGLLALAAGVWSARLAEPKLFLAFLVVLGAFLAGISGFDYRAESDSGPGEARQELWRRGRY